MEGSSHLNRQNNFGFSHDKCSQHLLIEKEVKNGKYNCYVNENLESWDGPKRQLKMNEAVFVFDYFYPSDFY